jgi:glycerol-3-phosphate O-acyltransferase
MSEPPTQRAESPAPPLAATPATSLPPADLFSAMTPRFNLFFRWFARRFFSHFGIDEKSVAALQELERQGTVVYVMRYASRLDYFLFNTLFLREGLRLSRFANGIRFHYYRPLLEFLRILLSRRGQAGKERDRGFARDLARGGQSFFLFLRTSRLTSLLASREQVVAQGHSELDLLEEVVHGVWDSERPIHLVPLAIFWRKGPRSRRRFLNLFYGAQTRPSDLAKVTSFVTTYRDLAVKVGESIDLRAFIADRRAQGEYAVARMVRRSILMFLYREEKVVEGPTLQPRGKIQEIVLADPGVEQAIRRRAEERGIPVPAARGDAQEMFVEIAAHMSSTFLAILNFFVSAIIRRLFASIEVSGIEKVADYAKRHPLVLLPSHRSYFDFLIVSSLFYANYLIPPHIAARENMAFGPFGYLFRRAGAFFLRRSFDDPLYKEVFRSYIGYLVSTGVTQEFFIEGGRSRTGKTLAPRLGMLSWDVDAFLATARRDLFFVPIAITYERLVEEGAMVEELEGGRKRDESVLGLVRARKFLQRRFGSVFVNFGEPISLAEALGPRRAAFAKDESSEREAEKRAFVERLGHRIVERINWAVVPNATSIAACALLGERTRGLRRRDLATRMQEIVDLLRLQDVRFTPALLHDVGEFHESIASLLRSDLIRSTPDPRGEILYFEERDRRVLDFYRNAIVHFVVAPSFLARRLLGGGGGGSGQDPRQDLAWWLDLFYHEYFTPRGEVLAAHFDAFVDHFERFGWVERGEGELRATEKGAPILRFLAEQTQGVVEAYWAMFAAVLATQGPLTGKGLQRAAREQFERAQLLGEVGRPEASNAVTFGNAIDLLVRRGVLAPGTPGPGRERARDTLYERGGSFDELPALRDRLATALGEG